MTLQNYILNGYETITLEYARNRVSEYLRDGPAEQSTCYLEAGEGWGHKFTEIETLDDKFPSGCLMASLGGAFIGLIIGTSSLGLGVLIGGLWGGGSIGIITALLSPIGVQIGLIVAIGIPILAPLGYFYAKNFRRLYDLEHEVLNAEAVQTLAQQILIVLNQKREQLEQLINKAQNNIQN